MKKGFRKVCAALCSTALLCAATAVPASASTVSDVIAAAYAVGIPAQYVQEGIAMYGGGNYTSEQCDQAIASNCWRIISAYRATAEIIITHLTITAAAITVTAAIITTLAAIPAEIPVHPETIPIPRAIPTVPTMPTQEIMAEHLAIQMVLSHLRI